MKNILNKNLNLKGKKVLLRVDLNVPMKNGIITEISRIEKILPTINLLLEKDAKIIIISHIGRPKGKVVKEMSLKPISEKLSYLLNREVSEIAKDNKLFPVTSNVTLEHSHFSHSLIVETRES